MYHIEPVPERNITSILNDLVDMSTVVESIKIWKTADAMFLMIHGSKADDLAVHKKFPAAVKTDKTDVSDWHETVEWHRRSASSSAPPVQKTLWSHLRLFDPDQPCVTHKPQRRIRKKA